MSSSSATFCRARAIRISAARWPSPSTRTAASCTTSPSGIDSGIAVTNAATKAMAPATMSVDIVMARCSAIHMPLEPITRHAAFPRDRRSERKRGADTCPPGPDTCPAPRHSAAHGHHVLRWLQRFRHSLHVPFGHLWRCVSIFRMRRAHLFQIVLGFASCAGSPAFAGDARGVSNPDIFAPSVISGPADDSAPAFSPDGNTVYFGRGNPSAWAILVSHRVNGAWSAPEVAPFSGQWNDMEPTMAPDGSYLIFVSSRPATDGGKPIDASFGGESQPGFGGNLWRVNREGSGWGRPMRLPDTVNRSTNVFAPSVAANGTLYFMEPPRDPTPREPKRAKFRLYRSEYKGGGYQPPQPLPFSDGGTTDVDSAVAPDESFIVFGSTRAPAKGMDLFLAFRRADRWCKPIHLGDTVNSPGSDAEARLGPDRRTLYFSSERALLVAQPRTAQSTLENLRRIQSWDNRSYNIWSVSLAPWLDSPRCEMN